MIICLGRGRPLATFICGQLLSSCRQLTHSIHSSSNNPGHQDLVNTQNRRLKPRKVVSYVHHMAWKIFILGPCVFCSSLHRVSYQLSHAKEDSSTVTCRKASSFLETLATHASSRGHESLMAWTIWGALSWPTLPLKTTMDDKWTLEKYYSTYCRQTLSGASLLFLKSTNPRPKVRYSKNRSTIF